MDEVTVQGMHSVEVRDGKSRIGNASVELRYRRVHVLPPIGKQKRYPALTLSVPRSARPPPIGPRSTGS
jgi:hypothetical protein